MDWQPIETAPKDGVPVLVWWPIRAINDEGLPEGEIVDGAQLVTEWHGNSWLEPDVLNCLNANAFDDDAEYSYEPTHWMPLPEPPQ